MALNNLRDNILEPLPADTEAERGLLGAVLLDSALWPDANAQLQRDWFVDPGHRAIFDSFGRCWGDEGAIDLDRVRFNLRDAGRWADLGDAVGDNPASYLAGLSGATAANFALYVGRLRERGLKETQQRAHIESLGALRNGCSAAGAITESMDALRSIEKHSKPENSGPVSFGALAEANPKLREPIIGGLLRRGETANIIAAPKVGKSWLGYGLLLSIASGEDWLGQFPCNRGKVLLIDNELHRPTLAKRIKTVADAMEIFDSDYTDRLHILSLRGRLKDLHGIAAELERIDPDAYDLILLDAFYRTLPAGVSENDNGAVAALYNLIDATTARLNCAWANIHHSSKGSQSDKSITDVGAGAGSQSRAADAHIVLRPHETQGVVVLDAVVRSFAPIEPLALRWTFPVWQPDDDVDTKMLKGRLTRQEQKRQDNDDAGMSKICDALLKEPATARALRRATGISRERCERLLDRLVGDGHITTSTIKVSGNECVQYHPVGDVGD